MSTSPPSLHKDHPTLACCCFPTSRPVCVPPPYPPHYPLKLCSPFGTYRTPDPSPAPSRLLEGAAAPTPRGGSAREVVRPNSLTRPPLPILNTAGTNHLTEGRLPPGLPSTGTRCRPALSVFQLPPPPGGPGSQPPARSLRSPFRREWIDLLGPNQPHNSGRGAEGVKYLGGNREGSFRNKTHASVRS